MLWLRQLLISNYRNYTQAQVTLSKQINCFVGKNGSGKTNLLDAIYYLSFTKSYFTPIDQQNIKFEEAWFSIEGNYDHNGLEEKVRMTFQKGEKKSVKVNNNEAKKFADHIGNYPLVMITPNDIMLIYEGSEDRRRFLDGMISQMDKAYLSDLLAYNRTLEQRNKQLKLFAEQSIWDITLLETYNAQLIKFGTSLYEKRKLFLDSFIPVFREYYQLISSSKELVNLNYESDLNINPYENLLYLFQQQDMAAQRTTKGIHKDELEFIIDGMPLKKYGSQGQQKSFLISLKLAQYAYLKEKTGTKPLLLLDDIFEKLDGERLQKLLNMMANDDFGQLFITDTHIERLKEVFQPMTNIDIKYFNVEAGIISEI